MEGCRLLGVCGGCEAAMGESMSEMEEKELEDEVGEDMVAAAATATATAVGSTRLRGDGSVIFFWMREGDAN